MKPSPIEILLVEDDVTDSRIVCEALLENEKRIRVHAVSDGQDAVDF
jgi:CheY-like chemotaxis protein